jgi:hypothetical protein
VVLGDTAGPRLPEVYPLSGKKLLSCLKKRDLLNSAKADASELREYGESYLSEGRLSDAIDFFEQAQHIEGLTQLKDRCAAEGDYFLFLRLAKILGESPSNQEWIHLGDNALALNKLFFARSAYLEADHHEGVARVEKLLKLQTQEKTSEEAMLH